MVSITNKPFPDATGKFALELVQELKNIQEMPKEEHPTYKMIERAKARRMQKEKIENENRK